jgi:biopolymer transport protein TolR
MASISEGGGSFGNGRKRSMDAEINLVPFIDLLSMCICFLLMTAVWTQLGSVQVKQANGTDAAQTDPQKTIDLDFKFNTASEAVISLKRSGKVAKTMKVQGANPVDLSRSLDRQLQMIRSELTREGAKVSSVFLTAFEGVDYGSMVSFMDVFRKNEMSNIGVVYASR